MALGEHGHHHALQEAVLADHHALDLVEDLLHQLRGIAGFCGIHVHEGSYRVEDRAKVHCVQRWVCPARFKSVEDRAKFHYV
jgi:hypothetical protein